MLLTVALYVFTEKMSAVDEPQPVAIDIHPEWDDPWLEHYPCPAHRQECKQAAPCQHVIDAHPATNDCPDMECVICSLRDCPLKCASHYEHDGCPACVDAENAANEAANPAAAAT
jgi:hypothetical protein